MRAIDHLRVAATLGAAVLVAAACGTSGGGESKFKTDAGGEPGGSAGGSAGAAGAAGSPGGGEPGFVDGTQPRRECVGLECQQVLCDNGGTTTLTGKVYDPSGTVPLYNAAVYVPNADLDPLTAGATCDRCGTAPSGKPVTTALTDASGTFKLDNVPVGQNIPLVIQIGKWRRKVIVPDVPRCATTPLQAGITRLPRTKAEGDIPKIAVTTGDADTLECFFRRIGIADAEFTNPAGAGRVHLYQGQKSAGKGAKIDAQTPTANSLWDDEAKLKSYDMVILSCEGAEDDTNKTDTARANVRKYLEAGGRVFASHYHYTWFARNAAGQAGANKNPLWPTAAAGWRNTSSGLGNRLGAQAVDIDESFPKGQAFGEWMMNVQGSTTRGKMDVYDLKKSVTSIDPLQSRRWIYESADGSAPKFMSFNVPLGKPADEQCGRGVFTDIHVTGDPTADSTFPQHCKTDVLLPQEKALIFMLFDLASCIQDESKPPRPPPSIPR